MENFNAVYIGKTERLAELNTELGSETQVIENLVLSPRVIPACFALDIWFNPQIIQFASISEAVKRLKQAGKYWYLQPASHIRRSRLIEGQLRKLPSLQRSFPLQEDIPSIGGFCLLDQHTLLYSLERLKPWPGGHCLFIEDKINPPNRAYLKLWEALSLLGRYPAPGDTALDLGASPGGWTYVMQSLGAEVTAVDKAALDPRIAALPGVNCLNQSAFALEPAKLDQSYDWVLSDIACYPERALSLIMKWLESGKARQMVFTVKLQGETDWTTLKQLQQIEGSSLLNLFYNKHEVTFFYPEIRAIPR
ncbi:methyltransferase [Legionella birminghamensis]|uniref:Methyltransferase n=1 Tax=Legionella birminghamensis TaxID=28083 RepID=A0A378IEC8_9GAMM|nr:SAM-dependent methyltransferase [Legionella birminghamensis]KTC68818.1 methyltransferase [Legionella birminghamensis]STX33240.1 methyltransferase [Legionella birminghamensis]